MKRIVFKIIVLLSVFHIVPAFAGADNTTSLEAPEVLDIDDPFARGLDRVADQATGGVPLPAPIGDLSKNQPTGAELLGEQSELALVARNYRVVGLAVSRKETKAQIFADNNEEILAGNKPLMAYARIGIFEDYNLARQTAIDLKSTSYAFLGAHFIMREDEEEDGIILDIGPTRNVVHAERYCELMMAKTNGLVKDCYAVLEYPGVEPLNTFSSTAMIRVAPYAVETVINDNNLFDLNQSARQLLTLREGDMLGNGNVNLTKITPQGVMLVAENGDVNLLPIGYVPERPFTAKPASTGLIPVPEITPGTLAPAPETPQLDFGPLPDAAIPVEIIDDSETDTNGS
ncbi:hypothetical protein [Candidatus Puniceispirillum sp.]|uniref:hypothetical protein n=1 Tax=Candidatus Puniceispirillum sp. TaxID=2026719 RepID=UPI003F695B5B